MSACVVDTNAIILKVPDAIVAATAHILSLPLVTRNLADFKRVPDLVLLDPLAG